MRIVRHMLFVAAVAAFGLAGPVAVGQSPTFTLRVTRELAGVQQSQVTAAPILVNTFDAAPSRNGNTPVSISPVDLGGGFTSMTSTGYQAGGNTVAGATGVATGTYTATGSGFAVTGADQYGGAGNTGKYFYTGAFNGTDRSATLQLSQTAYYFGLYWSAVDVTNRIEFYKGSTLVDVLEAGRLISNLSAAYDGNPNTGANTGEKYAFVNIYSDDKTAAGGFDRVVFNNPAGATGNESDNHTISFSTAVPTILRPDETLVPVPEPAGLLAAAGGLLALGRRVRRWGVS